MDKITELLDKRAASHEAFAVGTAVEIDNGFNKFTLGVVVSYENDSRNVCGHKGNYEIEVTGGVDTFGKPAKVGDIRVVLYSNVIAA